MRLRLRLVVRTAVACLLLAVGLVLVHLQQVHERSGQYRWTPSATPLQMQHAERDDRRARGSSAVPAGAVLLGRTEGGGRIYGPAAAGTTPTVVHVVGDGAFRYSLVGGP